MTFTVIDRKTGKEPTSRVIDNIARKGYLMAMDIDQFFVGEDGSLVLADDCGNIVYCDTERFEVIAEQEPQTDGWHDSEKPPKNDKYVLLSFSNYPLPCVGRYYGTDEEGGNYYEGDEEKPLIEYGLFVNGWMELPKCRRD